MSSTAHAHPDMLHSPPAFTPIIFVAHAFKSSKPHSGTCRHGHTARGNVPIYVARVTGLSRCHIPWPPQVPFYGMHPGQLLSLKLTHHTSKLLPFPPHAPGGFTQLCLDCWAPDPADRPAMPLVVQRLNQLAVDLLGEGQAVAMFPDVSASLAALRRHARQAAAAAAAAPAAAAAAAAASAAL